MAKLPSPEHAFSFDCEMAAFFLNAFANPSRLTVMRRLLAREWDVTSLATEVNLSQSSLSQHLKKLRDAKVVTTRRDAQTIYYSAVGHSAALVACLDSLATFAK
ncbi:metalloregulator ArsR/SmtB family transcription factor [Neorhizobium sp. NCHU2750]|uniref:ArsR/SmtB family transcription factor n=1 Tax=Neorhizobium sp. NCHU2750 TaxID=1825976 RepID=UPI000EB6F540|nr:nodulation repressor NolR [Neorhizobium sp. NCHU2750]